MMIEVNVQDANQTDVVLTCFSCNRRAAEDTPAEKLPRKISIRSYNFYLCLGCLGTFGHKVSAMTDHPRTAFQPVEC